MISEDIKARIEREIIYTALKNGEINSKPIFGVLMKDHAAELKAHIPELRETIETIADDYRALSMEDIRAKADDLGIEYVEKDTTKEMVELEVDGSFRVRIPPEPSKHLHAGHALSFFINAIYAERYEGDIVLRFEDTNPAKVAQEFVDSIREDVKEYLKIPVAAESFASDHMEDFTTAIDKLLAQHDAYVCFCERESMSKMRQEGIECGCRNKPVEEQNAEFENMRSGVYEPGEAVIRLAGDMEHKNAAMRDPVLARISTEPHFRLGSDYRVWPLYDLENVVMDGKEGITHILRDNSFGQMRAELQGEIRSRLGLDKARVYQYGRFVLEGVETSGRAIREGIAQGTYSGWDDPRLATLKTMKRRGIQAETFRDIAREVGLSPGQTRVDEKMIAKYNRRHIDRDAKRYSFVYDPVEIVIEGYQPRNVALKSHPELEAHDRMLHASGSFLIRSEDAAIDFVRLMEAGNVQRQGSSFVLVSESIDDFRTAGGSSIINWLPADDHRACEIVMPDGSTIEGCVESSISTEPVGSIVQLERFGFCRIDEQSEKTVLWFAHG